MESKFSISEILSTSWQALKSQIWILVGLIIGYCIFYSIIAFLFFPVLMKGSMGSLFFVYILIYLLAFIFILGYVKNIFQTLDGDEPQFSAYGQQARKVFTLFVSSLIVGIAISIGTLLFIIPGIYLALRLQFFLAFIVEEDTGIIESVQRSWEITRGQVLPLFLLALAMMGIAIVGIILFVVGIFVAYPLIYMMYGYAFRKLNSPLQVLEEVNE